VPFKILNLAKQIEIAIRISQLSCGELGVILIDNMEHLDDENYDAMLDQMELAANKNGLQFLGARVTNTPGLTIEQSADAEG
jgi:hypothetical protein